MATQAKAGYGTVFTYDSSEIGELQTPMPPNITTDTMEATHNSSPSAFKEYIPTLHDGGTIPLTGNYVPADVGQAKILADFSTAPVKTCTCVLPSGLGTATFSAFISAFQPVPDMTGKVNLNVTLQVTGPVTY